MFLSKAFKAFFDGLGEILQNPDIDSFMTWLFADGMWRIKRILIFILVVWILGALFKWFVLEKPAWKYKDAERAMKALDKLDELDYQQLLEVEEKSPLQEVRQAARTKNSLGYQIKYALENSFSPRRFAELETVDLNSSEDVDTEPGTLIVFTRGSGGETYIHRATYSLPKDIRSSCPEAAEYRLELKYCENAVGAYTDGSSAWQSYVNGKLTRDLFTVWESSISGGKPPSQKYWGSANNTGKRADATPLVLRAIRTVRGNRKSG
ncbi:MAG: hypothetical protein IKP86_04870 [Anaerolineaceae bacterium]|nr:hypothetical protein [Anaerolineaceae bacterium]